jgi:Planctomycete cytochrome C
MKSYLSLSKTFFHCALLLACLSTSSARAELTADQKKAISEIQANLQKTAALWTSGKADTAVTGVRRVTAQITPLMQSGSPEVAAALESSIKMLRTIHARIELSGVVIPPLRFDTPATAASSAEAPTSTSASSPVPMETPTSTAPAMDPAKPSPAPSDGPVSFALQVAPLLSKNCNGCHIGGGNIRGNLDLGTFAAMFAGGDSGDAIEKGNGAESLLVKRLKGEDGDLMPAGGRPPLKKEEIELISKWIDEGAKLDTGTDTQPLSVLTKMAWATKADPAELTARRSELAKSDVALVGAANVLTQETQHFLVIGPVSEATLDIVAKSAETHTASAQSLVKGEAGEKLFRGKATIYVWPSRYDYSEFSKMVESRSIPSHWTSHWRSDGLAAYIALVATESDDPKAIASRLTSPVLSLAVATRGDVPRWMAEGIGTYAGIRQIKDRKRIQEIQQQTQAAWLTMPSSKEFLDGKMSPEESDFVGAAVASEMLGSSRRKNFDNMIRLLGQGKPFNESFQMAYGGSIENFVQALKGK